MAMVSAFGCVTCWPSLLVPKPTSRVDVAPRARAWQSSSSTSVHAPSPITRPSRSASKGRAVNSERRCGTGGEQGVEYRRCRDVEFFRTAGEHGDLMPGADRLVRIADALTARGARARRGDHATGHSEEHADVHRRGVAHHLDVGGRVDRLGVHLGQHAAEIAHRRRRAGGGPIRDAELAAADPRIAEQAGVGEREPAAARRHQGNGDPSSAPPCDDSFRQHEVFRRHPESRVQAAVRATASKRCTALRHSRRRAPTRAQSWPSG